jgi:hypothetical protein
MADNKMHRPKLRSLIGIILFVAYVTVYVLIAMAIGARYLAGARRGTVHFLCGGWPGLGARCNADRQLDGTGLQTGLTRTPGDQTVTTRCSLLNIANGAPVSRTSVYSRS